MSHNPDETNKIFQQAMNSATQRLLEASRGNSTDPLQASVQYRLPQARQSESLSTPNNRLLQLTQSFLSRLLPEFLLCSLFNSNQYKSRKRFMTSDEGKQ